MAVSQTNHVQQGGIETLPFDAAGNEINPSGSTLHQLFQNDCVGLKGKNIPAITLEEKAPSFWSRISSWFNQVDPEAESSLTSSSKTELKQAEPVSLLPELDAPDVMPPELERAFLPPPAKSKSSRQTLSPAELSEAASLMSDRTIEEIVNIIMIGQIELEKENALVADNTFTKFQDIKKVREKVLEKIKDALMKDEKVLGWCKSAQNAALVASFVCGLFTVGAAFGLAGPYGIIPLISSYGSITAAGLTGLAAGSKAYSQQKMNVDKGEHEQYNHLNKYTNDRIEDIQGWLTGVMEADQVFKERLVQLLKRFSKMIQLVMQK